MAERRRRGQTVRRARLVPFHRRERGVEVRLLHYALDDGPPRELPEVVAALDLSAHRFERLGLEVEVRVPPHVVASVVPPAERDDPPLDLVVVLWCADTRARRVVRRRLAAAEEGAIAVPFEVARADLRGAVEVAAQLVRPRACERPVPGYGVHAAALLAGSNIVRILLDAPSRRAGGYLDIRYESFSKSPCFEPGTLFRLECETDAPVLFVDADETAIRQLLDSRGRTGPVARAREVVFDAIGQVVWYRLYIAAIGGVDEEGTCTYAWQDGVLRRLLPKLYPEMADHASRVRQLCAEREEAGIAAFADRLEVIVQMETKLSHHVRALAKELG